MCAVFPVLEESEKANGDTCDSEVIWGWLGGAMVLGKLPVPGRPTILITVGQGPVALAVSAEGVVWTF